MKALHPASSMLDHLEISFVSITDEVLTAQMPVTEKTCQVHGFLNGGASLALCEICAGAYSRHFLKGTGKAALGVQVSGNHLHTARLGEIVTCRVTPIKLGSRMHVFQAQVLNAEGTLLSHCTVANMVVKLDE